MIADEERYDLVVKGGRVIDPRNGVDAICDVAIRDGRIAAVGPSLNVPPVCGTFDASAMIVTPGMIDLHTHIYHAATYYGVEPDPVAQRSAVTTMVDAGSAGAGNFAGLRKFVAQASRSRILAYLNISYPGIFAFDQDFMFGEASVAGLLSVDRCVAVAEANRDMIVGVKVRLGGGTSGAIGLLALERAIAAAERLDLPVMCHIGKPPPTYSEILERLRPGDVLTHCFRPAPNAPVNDRGAILPAVAQARERGVLFDIGHGMGAFGFESAEAALAEGFAPDIISSDVHVLSVNGPAFDLLHTMSKVMNCGVGLADAVAMVTDIPARAIRRPNLGHLAPGALADISLIDIVEARFPFVDVAGQRRESSYLLRPRGLMIGGELIHSRARAWEEEFYSEGIVP